MTQNDAYYKRSVVRIQDLIKEHQDELERLKQENIKLRKKLEQGHKELKGRIIRLEDTLVK